MHGGTATDLPLRGIVDQINGVIGPYEYDERGKLPSHFLPLGLLVSFPFLRSGSAVAACEGAIG